MRPINILIVDDSAFMRNIIIKMLAENKEFNILGTARDGYDALAKIVELKPDVVTLDIEMPGMGGINVLRRIMATSPVPVIMVSSHTQRGSVSTQEALSMGAVDFVAKPSLNQDIRSIQEELAKKIMIAAKVNLKSLSVAQKEKLSFPSIKKFSQCMLVAIGASTGGPRALEKVLKCLPATFSVPIVITQHMPAGFTKAFADRLNGLCSIKVKEAQVGDRLQRGCAYIAPGGFHLEVTPGGLLALNQNPPVEHVRPSVDVMLKSAINVYGGNIIGVILTGMGKDGAASMLALKERGGKTIVQDEQTAVIFSMPNAVIKLNAADTVAPIQDIAGILNAAVL